MQMFGFISIGKHLELDNELIRFTILMKIQFMLMFSIFIKLLFSLISNYNHFLASIYIIIFYFANIIYIVLIAIFPRDIGFIKRIIYDRKIVIIFFSICKIS